LYGNGKLPIYCYHIHVGNVICTFYIAKWISQ